MNYLLMGNETYNLRQRREEIEKEAGADLMNISVYPFDSKALMSDIIADCQTLPFFADKKLVILENPPFIMKRSSRSSDDDADDNKKDSSSDLGLLEKYLDSPNESTVLIIYIDEDVNRSRKEIRSLSKKMKTEIYDQLKPEDFRHYVMQDLNDAGIKLDYPAIEELIQRLPLSIENWKRELDKLTLYPGRISKDVIKELIARPLEDDVFKLSDGVVKRNLSQSLSVFNDLMTRSKNDVYSLVGLLASQFRFMCQCKALAKTGYNQLEISKEMKAHEYRVKMSMQSAGMLCVEDLLGILNQLAELDQNIKTGRVDPQKGLEMFIISRCRK
ncbi:MAG: DNA polymerase III subunit delta [Erysipelotrichaceae bacterium]|nr:DNA polymerase III subunit delta [Erysipelotrichaceae bacterium]